VAPPAESTCDKPAPDKAMRCPSPVDSWAAATVSVTGTGQFDADRIAAVHAAAESI
jgi:hypothetical protein